MFFPKAVILFTITLFVGLAQAQSGRSRTNANSPDAVLAKPVDWGAQQSRLFKSVDMNVNFSLQTSWIPGENRKGMFRYKITASPEKPESHSTDEIENFVKLVHSCQITLDLYDVDGFLLRSLTVPFSFGVDENARVRRLLANSASQMDASEYRQLLGVPGKSGSWSVGWSCIGNQ